MMDAAAVVPLDALYEAIFLTDRDFRVIDCNSQAVALLRAPSKAAVIGRSAKDISTNHDLSGEFPTYLHERLGAVPFVVLECQIARDDGTRFFAEAAAHRVDDETVLFSVRDITVRTESLHRLEEANERLRATNRDRMEFVSNVSHELRTPLTSMSYALANMRRGLCGALPEKASLYLERLQVDVKRLMTTVNDILDLRQLENGTLQLHKTCVALRALLGEAAASLAIQAEAKRQTLTVEPSPREVYAEADRHKVERVFFNILSNAVKYTPEAGHIRATIQEALGMAQVIVDDDGIGIPPEALPRVSQRYFRVGDQVAGTGLGLSIVREITELHGGSLQILSPVPGSTCGTRVVITLPTRPGPTVAILSGDEAFIAAVSAEVSALGNVPFPNREAIDIAKECAAANPSRFVLDGSLPPSCLSDWICQIRASRLFAQVPILILSPEPDSARAGEYARMHVDLRPWPFPAASLRAWLLSRT